MLDLNCKAMALLAAAVAATLVSAVPAEARGWRAREASVSGQRATQGFRAAQPRRMARPRSAARARVVRGFRATAPVQVDRPPNDALGIYVPRQDDRPDTTQRFFRAISSQIGG